MKRAVWVVTLVSLFGIGCKQSSPPPAKTKTAESGSAVDVPVAKQGSGGPAVAPGSGSAAADPWTKTTEQADPLPHPLFWAVAKDGKTTYMLGTMHLGVDAEKRLPKVVWDKLDAAPVFAMETDLSDPSVMNMGKRKSGTLHDELGPVYWKKLEEIVTPPVAQSIDHMKPMIAATLLSMRGLPTTPPMDGVLLGRALNQKKAIVYLEPASKQAAILEKWMDLRTLKMMLDDPKKGEQQTKDMLDAYIAGDEAAIEKLADAQKEDALKHGFTAKEYDESMEDMLYKRNASWIDAFEKLHQQNGGFVAVGALHLVGKRSVLDLLKSRGYTVTRVTP
ncbi:MAG TPA: TraB/GumN family protein [Kofleriaceae bacterium]|nr:TraB/GumN family protein [Kofleriaceae bacterium]